MERAAVFSDDRRFRFRLERKWAEGPTATWVMLNPSMADAEQDDPTVRCCISFSKREGCGRLVIVNLSALITPYPWYLFSEEGGGFADPENRKHLSAAVGEGGLLIVAWGANGARVPGVAGIAGMLAFLGAKCFGLTKEGQPRHPLYLPSIARLVSFAELLEQYEEEQRCGREEHRR